MSDVLERFMRYVQVDSGADPLHEETVPSNPAEFAMAQLLAAELEQEGAEDVTITDHSYVTASIPASPGAEKLPALGLIAHIDTSFDAPDCGVKPHVVHYEGGDLVAGVVDGHEVSTSPVTVPDLQLFVGQDIVTSDGTTLLSADDKAGVAEIMALVHRLHENPEIPHPCIKVAFVPDEEIGHGASLLDLEDFGAAWAYTVDGEALGEFNYECFSADQVDLTFTGQVVHPGSAKDKMVNALTVWREFDSMLPQFERPEHTEGYEGYYHALRIEGSPAEVKVSYIVRDFDATKFDRRIQTMEETAEFLNHRYGEGTVAMEVIEEYRNMAEQFESVGFLIQNALEANRACGVEPKAVPARGGTDGAQLTFRGLPCPNIATGGYEPHSVHEFIPVSNLEKTVDILENLVGRFAEPVEAVA